MSLSDQKPSANERSPEAPFIRDLSAEDFPVDARYGTRWQFSVSSSQKDQLERGVNLVGATMSEYFLTGFAALLSRLSRQDVVSILLPNHRAVRFNLEGQSSFRRAVQQCKSESVSHDLFPGQIIGFRYGSNERISDHDLPFDLHLQVSNEGTDIELSSPTSLWKADTLRSWAAFLAELLSSASAAPDAPISTLPLWDDSSAEKFYSTLNSTETTFQGPASVPALVADQASRLGCKLAVVSQGRQYTYDDLYSRSTALAQELILAGGGRNRAVAVCMERSVDLPVSLLAVLRSGSYYIPLDPHNPIQRLQGILEECKPIALLTDSAIEKTLDESLSKTGTPMIRVDHLSKTAANFPDLPTEFFGDDLAYAIYTSGTTGKPKGVKVTHRALHNLICSMSRSPGFHETDRALAVAPISFDIATMDMFLPLCTGGTLVIASKTDASDPFKLADLVVEHDITYLQATPATWRMLITSGWKGKPEIKMITGGEAIPRELVNELIQLGGELWNCYGPTETTIYSGVIQLKSEPGIVPVGQPIANTSFFVMDSTGRPVPPGVPGELYIGGDGVSPGYVARPELTAERFVPDRFGRSSSGTLFRTGDLVRIVKDNELEFFGRLDHQVKLRGFRIELGEIESVLRAHPSITDAVVILREDVPGEPRLVAYVISGSDRADAKELRAYAAQLLPEYMLPSIIVTLDHFPLSTSGKIDRKAFPVPESFTEQSVEDSPESVSPSSAIETKLLSIFREILRSESIGVTDSFFRYGGYSLLTVRLFSRIERELGIRLPISLLFDAPTVRQLARVIEKGSSPSALVPIRPGGRLAPLFIIQSYLLYNVMLELVEADRPIYGLRETTDESAPLTIEERARRFAAEIRSVQPEGPIYLSGWCAAGTLTVEIARQLREAGHIVGLVVLFDAERPGFGPARGLKAWLSRARKKSIFHFQRIHAIPWKQRVTYFADALARNWDLAVEAYYTTHYRSMLWMQRKFGLSLSAAAFNNVYAELTALRDFTVLPYPGKLTLYRAGDVPDFAEFDATLGWGAVALEGVDVDFVPGDHISMFKQPNVTSLAQRLQKKLQRSEPVVTRN